MTHPARFSPQIVDELAPILENFALPVHDPFAGEGARLGRLCESLGIHFSGTEIEPEFIGWPSVHQGDSTKVETYPAWEHLVCTSPVYPNGMTDHFKATDASRRYTYRAALTEARNGVDRPLHENNMGRYGNAHRRSKRVEAEHWRLAHLSIRWWPELVIVNVKDVVTKTYEVAVVNTWINMLGEHGYEIEQILWVDVPGMKDSPNRERAEQEAIIVARDSSRVA